jgi:lipopolysaccharide transport system permease protein
VKEVLAWFHYIWYFSREELRRQHARSALGYFWIVLSQFVNIAGIALIFGAIFKQDLKQFLPYVSAGIVSWNLFANLSNESSRLYQANAPIIQNFKFPLWVFVLQLVAKHLIVFAHALLVHFLIMLALGANFSWLMWLTLPSIALMTGVLILIGQTSALVGARFRDFAPALGNLIYLFFLITPIIWERSLFPGRYAWLLDLNPFTHLIDVMRAPMIGKLPQLSSYAFTAALMVGLYVVRIAVVKKHERNVVFWF